MSRQAQVLIHGRKVQHSVARDDVVGTVSVDLEVDDLLLLSVADAGRRIGVSRAFMYELIGKGVIESVHVGRLRKVPTAALAEFVQRIRDDASTRQ
jgi:excisionase family DNA binding protein